MVRNQKMLEKRRQRNQIRKEPRRRERGPKRKVIILKFKFCSYTLLPSMLSAPLILLPNMYHDNRGRLSAHHTLLSNMYHDNGGRLTAYHTLISNMYHDNRGRHSAHHILLPNMYHNNRGRLCSPHLAI